MARKVVLVSDISGKEAPEADFIKLIVRTHPAVDQPKSLDVLPDEVKALKEAPDLVTLQIGENGEKRTVVVSLTDFRKLVSDDKVVNAAGTRGRPTGWSPANKS